METEVISQIWVVDDLAAAGKPEDLKVWYDKMKKNGPKYGYKVNKNKSYILAKDDRILKPFEEDIKKEELQQAVGARYLGAPIGTMDFKSEFFKIKIEKINEKIRKLTRLPKTSPYAAYYIFTA